MGETYKSFVDDQSLSARQAVGLAVATILGGVGWPVLTSLGARATGGTEYLLGYATEPAVAFCALLGVYGFARQYEADVLSWGRAGYRALFGGFLVVGVPAALDGVVVSVPGLWLLLGQPDGMLVSTLAGGLLIYAGFFLLGLDSRLRDHAFGWPITYTFLFAGPLAVSATALTYVTAATAWITTAVIAPIGLSLVLLGVLLVPAPLTGGARPA